MFLIIRTFEHAVSTYNPRNEDMANSYEHETESDDDCEVYCKYEKNTFVHDFPVQKRF